MAMAQQVIIQQPAGMQQWYPQDMREWDTGICGCAEDCGICCLAFWCPCIEMCNAARAMGETKCVCCVSCGMFHHYAGLGLCLVSMRTKTRTALGIRGSVCGDCCCVTCCPILTLCQMSRQLRHAGRR